MSKQKHDVQETPASAAGSNNSALFDSLSRHDMEALLRSVHSPAGIQSNSEHVDFGSTDIYAKSNRANGSSLNDVVRNLQMDAGVLQHAGKDSALYKQAETYLSADEAALKSDVFGLERNSSNFESFAGTMSGFHGQLKEVADVLWGMGLKDQASQTTAYFPLDHYKHEFKEYGGWIGSTGQPGSPGQPGLPEVPTNVPSPGNNGTNPGGDTQPPTPSPAGAPGLPGAAIDSNLQAQNWKSNTNDGEIGGSGNVQGMTIRPGQIMDYSSQVGAWGDTLASNNQSINPGDKNFQFNYQFDPSTNTFKNTQCLEADMVVTTANGQHAVIGSQFNMGEKAPSGMCWFQTWNTQTGHWENAALVPTPKAGQFNNVSMSAKLNGDGTYTYTNLTYDGQTYALQNNTFGMVGSNWTKNEAVLQLQEDANSQGGPLDVQYTGISFEHS